MYKELNELIKEGKVRANCNYCGVIVKNLKQKKCFVCNKILKTDKLELEFVYNSEKAN